MFSVSLLRLVVVVELMKEAGVQDIKSHHPINQSGIFLIEDGNSSGHLRDQVEKMK